MDQLHGTKDRTKQNSCNRNSVSYLYSPAVRHSLSLAVPLISDLVRVALYSCSCCTYLRLRDEWQRHPGMDKLMNLSTP
jgi:hypothetical protein